jgi:hypothetical protein
VESSRTKLAARDRALERAETAERKDREFIERLAAGHAERTGLSLKRAREHVEQVAVTSYMPREDETIGIGPRGSFCRYG